MPRKAILLAATIGLAGLVPAAPATADNAVNPTHVAIVIAGHGVACVHWHSGITGDEVLNDVATVKYRPTDGLITQIDGTPKNNRADESHYWSYWHNTGSGWRYSTSGASAYHPKAGSVEGWHFINGSPNATPPPTRTYASICHDTVVSAPAPPARPTTSAATSRSTAAATTSTHSAAVSTTRDARAPTTSHRASTSSAPARSSTSPAAPFSSTAATTTPKRTSALPTLHARNTADATHPAGGSALPTVLVVLIVLALGGVAAFLAQRRHRNT